MEQFLYGPDLEEVFDQQIALEQLAATIYGRFATRFAAIREASDLWSIMVRDEESHAAAFYWCRSLLIDVKAKAKPCPCLPLEPRRAGMETARRVLRLSASPALTLEEAIEATVEIENLEIVKISRILLDLPENDIFREVIQQLAGDETAHASRCRALQDLIQRSSEPQVEDLADPRQGVEDPERDEETERAVRARRDLRPSRRSA